MERASARKAVMAVEKNPAEQAARTDLETAATSRACSGARAAASAAG